MNKISLEEKTILVTGSAGFIGCNLVKRLFKDLKSATIVGIDNMNDYYDVALKEYRLEELSALSSQTPDIKYYFFKGDIASKETIDRIFEDYKPEVSIGVSRQDNEYRTENIHRFLDVSFCSDNVYRKNRGAGERILGSARK